MKEYALTVEAKPMTATEAMTLEIGVGFPYDSEGISRDGYIIGYPCGHIVWLSKERFKDIYTIK